MAKISMNTDVAHEVLTYLGNSCTFLGEEVASGMSKEVQTLSSLGLLSNSISKVQDQIKSIVKTEQEIISSISSHLSEVEEQEKNLKKRAETGSNGSGSNKIGNSSGSNGSDINSEEEDDGKKINVDGFTKILETLNDTEKGNLLKLLNINKNDNKTIAELLLDTSNSEELFTLLKTVLQNTVQFKDLTLDEIKEVQKVLLNSIVSSETEYEEIKDNSILMAKTYLSNVCKEYRITASDLIQDDLYKSALKQSLKKLYDGNVDGKVTDSEVLKFRKYVDSIALEKSVTAYDLIDNKTELLI